MNKYEEWMEPVVAKQSKGLGVPKKSVRQHGRDLVQVAGVFAVAVLVLSVFIMIASVL